MKPKETLNPCKICCRPLNSCVKNLITICKKPHCFYFCLLSLDAHSWSFSWRRNGKYFNVARDSQASMRRRSGTLDIYAWNNPEQYEAEYQCIASNEYGSAYSNKIRLRLYSKTSVGTVRESMTCFSSTHGSCTGTPYISITTLSSIISTCFVCSMLCSNSKWLTKTCIA